MNDGKRYQLTILLISNDSSHPTPLPDFVTGVPTKSGCPALTLFDAFSHRLRQQAQEWREALGEVLQ